jgi:hypothetical protein
MGSAGVRRNPLQSLDSQGRPPFRQTPPRLPRPTSSAAQPFDSPHKSPNGHPWRIFAATPSKLTHRGASARSALAAPTTTARERSGWFAVTWAEKARNPAGLGSFGFSAARARPVRSQLARVKCRLGIIPYFGRHDHPDLKPSDGRARSAEIDLPARGTLPPIAPVRRARPRRDARGRGPPAHRAPPARAGRIPARPSRERPARQRFRDHRLLGQRRLLRLRPRL